MVKKQISKKTGETRITFVLPTSDPRLPASVVGDFNDWDPLAHPFRKRTNGTYSVAVSLAPGRRYEFRYLGNDGHWFDEEPDGELVTRGAGGANCVVCC
ncbi:MAG: isoamylase early set domain-containing protein [Gemmatimonadota bacterium]|jgi:1,4-alpha-glucan branching enzyme